MKRRLILIALDAADRRLIRTWAAEGHLPILAKLLDTAAVACVVPAAKVPVGAPLLRAGGVVSGGGATANWIGKSSTFAFPAASMHRT